MRKKLLWGILLLSLGGGITSWLATQEYLNIQQNGLEQSSFCSINNVINCDLAYASSHATFLGIPVAWFGLLFFAWALLTSLWILIDEKKSGLAQSAWFMSLVGVAVSLYKLYISYFVLHVFCILCLTMDVAVISIFLCWHFFLGLKWKAPRLPLAEPKIFCFVTILVFGLGWLIIGNLLEKAGVKKLNVPVAEVVQYHFKQGEYQFDLNPANPVWGNPNAKITVIEFSDFECPFCRRAAFLLKPYLNEFKDKIRFYFYNYPLDQSCNPNMTTPLHKDSCMAAKAARCAFKKGDFWNFHDEIFRNQKNLSEELMLKLAEKQGWKADEFKTCMQDPAILDAIHKDIDAAQKMFIEGTPTVIINNRRVKYWFFPEALRAIVNEEIKRTK